VTLSPTDRRRDPDRHRLFEHFENPGRAREVAATEQPGRAGGTGDRRGTGLLLAQPVEIGPCPRRFTLFKIGCLPLPVPLLVSPCFRIVGEGGAPGEIIWNSRDGSLLLRDLDDPIHLGIRARRLQIDYGQSPAEKQVLEHGKVDSTSTDKEYLNLTLSSVDRKHAVKVSRADPQSSQPRKSVRAAVECMSRCGVTYRGQYLDYVNSIDGTGRVSARSSHSLHPSQVAQPHAQVSRSVLPSADYEGPPAR